MEGRKNTQFHLHQRQSESKIKSFRIENKVNPIQFYTLFFSFGADIVIEKCLEYLNFNDRLSNARYDLQHW